MKNLLFFKLQLHCYHDYYYEILLLQPEFAFLFIVHNCEIILHQLFFISTVLLL